MLHNIYKCAVTINKLVLYFTYLRHCRIGLRFWATFYSRGHLRMNARAYYNIRDILITTRSKNHINYLLTHNNDAYNVDDDVVTMLQATFISQHVRIRVIRVGTVGMIK